MSEQTGEIVQVMKAAQAAWEYLVLLVAASSSNHHVCGKRLLHSNELCQVPVWDGGKPRSLGRSKWAPAMHIKPG